MDLLADLTVKPRLAPIKYRISAAIIDFLILWLISFLMGYLFGEYYISDDSMGYHLSGFPAFLMFTIDFVLISIQEGLTGKTIGKRIVKIKVMKEDFSENSATASIVRHLFDIIDMILFVGIIVAAAGQKRQRIGDLIAKTIVVID
jgi:uncharacterized RDD family membrane protein YckC